MGEPGARIQPSPFLHQVHRAAAESFPAEGHFVHCFRQVGMQQQVFRFRHPPGVLHQRRGHGKRRAGRQANPHHGSRRSVVILRHQTLAVRQNLILALDHRGGR